MVVKQSGAAAHWVQIRKVGVPLMKALTAGQIKALIVLLGDEDQQTAQVARENLLREGEAARPHLEEAREAPDPRVRGRVRAVLEELRLERLRQRLARYAAAPDDQLDLEEGALLLAEYEYPELDHASVRSQLDGLADQARHQMAGAETPIAQATVLSQHLFHRLGFRGDIGQYYHPDNSFLNRVIERRIGIPITLSLLFILVGRRLGLNVQGVAMPGHFIVQLSAADGPRYLDPFNQGQLLTRSDCVAFLLNNGFGFQDSYLNPASVRRILIRMLTNLVQLYTQREELSRVAHVSGFLELLRR